MAAPGAQSVVQLPIISQDNVNKSWHFRASCLLYAHTRKSKQSFYCFKPPPPSSVLVPQEELIEKL